MGGAEVKCLLGPHLEGTDSGRSEPDFQTRLPFTPKKEQVSRAHLSAVWTDQGFRVQRKGSVLP